MVTLGMHGREMRSFEGKTKQVLSVKKSKAGGGGGAESVLGVLAFSGFRQFERTPKKRFLEHFESFRSCFLLLQENRIYIEAYCFK